MDWFVIYPKIDDWHIYLQKDLVNKHYCNDQMCHRLLSDTFDNKKLSSIVKIKADFVLLSSMNIFLGTDNFISILKKYANNDFRYSNLNDNVNIIEITSTCTINSEYIDESPICPECKNPLSRSYSRAFINNNILLFNKPDNDSSQICRTKITMRDSARATYDLFVRHNLAKELEKLNCFDILKCIVPPVE